MPSAAIRTLASAAAAGADCQAQSTASSSDDSCTQLPPFVQTSGAWVASVPSSRIGPVRNSRPCDVTETGSAFETKS